MKNRKYMLQLIVIFIWFETFEYNIVSKKITSNKRLMVELDHWFSLFISTLIFNFLRFIFVWFNVWNLNPFCRNLSTILKFRLSFGLIFYLDNVILIPWQLRHLMDKSSIKRWMAFNEILFILFKDNEWF